MKKMINGYTLIELLVVIVIIAILATIGFINYKTFSETQKLNEGVSLVQSTLRAAQSNATAAFKCSGEGGATWFVSFEDNKNFNLKCKVGEATASAKRSYSLPVNIQVVKISTCRLDFCMVSCDATVPFSVNFSPLYGDISFKDAGGSSSCVVTKNTLNIRLMNTQTAEAKNVTVSKGGGIDAQK